MRINVRHVYAQDAPTVFGSFIDREQLKAKHNALGARNFKITKCVSNLHTAEVAFVREIPAEVPVLLKRFLQPWNKVLQREHWQKNKHGDFHAALCIRIENVPVDIRGKLHLYPEGDGAVNDIELTIDCGIPVVGKKLEQFVARDCRRLIAAEHKYLTTHLD